ncbi:MAG: DUF3107 domain-containing protein [Acidimicrobiales bacterium]
MELRIGVTQAPRELELELPDDADREALLAEVDSLLARGDGVLSVTDRRGRRVSVPVPRIAWVEVGAVARERRVGFGAS